MVTPITIDSLGGLKGPKAFLPPPVPNVHNRGVVPDRVKDEFRDDKKFRIFKKKFNLSVVFEKIFN